MSETRTGAASAAGLAAAIAISVVAAFFASFLGRFLSYAGAGGEAPSHFPAVMVIAVYGPFVIAAVAAALGISFSRKRGWVYPLTGVVAMWVSFMVCANSLG